MKSVVDTYPPRYRFGIISVKERDTQQFHNAFSIIVFVRIFLVPESDMVMSAVGIIDSQKYRSALSSHVVMVWFFDE